MKAGILAAGEGARLRELGSSKPLVRIGAVTLLERTLSMLEAARVDEVTIIVSEAGRDVARFARGLRLPFPLHVIVQTTPSSLHSLGVLAGQFATPGVATDDRFLLCTVDSVVAADEFVAFVERFRASPEIDLLLSYTDFVDDEMPLRIAVAADGRVSAVGPIASASPFVTVGVYGMSHRVLTLSQRMVAEGQTRLRSLLSRSAELGLRAWGHRFSKALDVDRPTDVEEAERFLSELRGMP